MPYNYFPSTQYDNVLVTDILKRFQFSDGYKKSSFVENYTIKDDETPESLAYLLYKDATYSWIILMLNNITDRHNEWPYSYRDLQSIIENKYSGSSMFFRDEDIDFGLFDAFYFTHLGTRYDIKSLDRNFNRITSYIKLNTITEGQQISVFDVNGNLLGQPTVRRLVYEDSFSLHHFEIDGEYADPRDEEFSLLQSYTATNDQSEEYAITNYQYEIALNDSKRDILLVQSNEVEAILTAIQRLFGNIDKTSNILEIRDTIGDISE